MTNTITAQEYLSLPTKAKATRRKPVQRESQLQQSCVRWFRLTYPQYAQLLFSIPNGGHRNIITAARMKAEGQVAGVPDIFFASARKQYHGLFIEMKAEKGKLSKAQTESIARLIFQGYKVSLCNSLMGFQTIINDYIQCQPS